MNITVIGTGYVGLVTAACLADVGHTVCGLDCDQSKLDLLEKGEMPIYEPGLDEIVLRGMKEKHLWFTSCYTAAMRDAEVVFLAVGTPPDEDGSADLSHVLAAANEAVQHVQNDCLLITKSTVPVGTGDKVEEVVKRVAQSRSDMPKVSVASNPEFLREGQAVIDFMKPDRIVAGVVCDDDGKVFEKLYEPFSRVTNRLILMDRRSAEVAKYAANAMLATRISFMNEISQLCDVVGADVESIRRAVGADPRIGKNFLYAGVGYGGSCFPKDVQALELTGQEFGVDMKMVRATRQVNATQRAVFVQRILDAVADIESPTVALWGLAFKPKTDDMREAPSRDVVVALLKSGVKVKAYDPVAMDVAKGIWGQAQGLSFMETAEACLHGADALVVVTEWMCFRAPDWDQAEQVMSHQILFDGRNLYDPDKMRARGWAYTGVGRGRLNSHKNKRG
ncbi:MAG: UDP-glucose/GDP-mannose dehydrogenase family protein [Mariprofundaceae bacterium]